MNKSNKLKSILSYAVVVLIVAAVLLATILPSILKKEVVHLVVLAGQSNCEGVSLNDELQKYVSEETFNQYKTGFENIKITNKTNGVSTNGFVNCALGQGTNKSCFGIELGMADYLSKQFSNEKFYFVKRAHGGTSIFPYWHAPENDSQGMFFIALLQEVKDSIAVLEKQGKEVVVEAFCWMQGEQDATEKSNVETYGHYLSVMVAYFRDTFKKYNKGTIRFVDAGITPYELMDPYYNQEINQIKQAFSWENSQNFYIDTDAIGLTRHLEPVGNPDKIHLDSFSMLKLGREFGKLAYSK